MAEGFISVAVTDVAPCIAAMRAIAPVHVPISRKSFHGTIFDISSAKYSVSLKYAGENTL